MDLFDTHAHLDDDQLYSEIDVILKSAKENGVKYITTIGIDIKTSKAAVAIAHKYSNVFACVAIYPEEINNMGGNDLNELEDLLQDEKVVGLGEIGLDYHQDIVDKEKQKEYFSKFIKLAYKYKKPIAVHSRDAALDTLNVLKENKEYLTKGIMHCYSYSKEMVQEFVDIGFYISFAGPVTFKNAKEPKEAAKVVPLDRILVETDSPYLSPEPKRGKRNEPSHVRYTNAMIASIKGLSEEEMAKITFENAKRVYGIKED